MAFGWDDALMIGAPIIGGLMGAEEGNKNRDAAERARQAALAQYAGLTVPGVDEQKLLLEQYANSGYYNPAMESVINQGPTAMEGISLDPQMRAKQMQAMEQMSQLATNGVTPADQAVMELARRNSASEAEAKQQQIMQNMQARGMGGSGAELIARLNGAQSGADRLQQANLEQVARSQQARMQATEQLGNMSGQLRSQDYGEQANLAQGRDAVSRMNAANAQQVNSRNTASANQGQMYNVNNNQNIANNNVNFRNQQQQYNKGLQQQQFNNQMTLANARAGQYNGQAQANDTRAGQTAGMWAGVGQGVGTAIATANNTHGYKYDPMTGKPIV